MIQPADWPQAVKYGHTQGRNHVGVGCAAGGCIFDFKTQFLRPLLGKLNEKGKRHFRWIPNGIPGVATRLPILFSEGVMKGRIDLNRFVAVTSTNHAKLYVLYPRKGTIAIGSDADITLWDPNKQITLTNELLHHGADYTPFEGLAVRGWPIRVIVRGATVVEDGQLCNGAGIGTYVSRKRSSLVSERQK